MQHDQTLDVNFWASFADLMLALVLVMSLLLFLVMAVISYGTVNLETVEQKQMTMIDAIVKDFGAEQKQEREGFYRVLINQGGKIYDVQIENDLDTQKMTFSDRLLFAPDDYHLNGDGQDTLRLIGRAILAQSKNLKEIQIQGHADIRNSKRFPSETGNTELAALRSLEVYKFLRNSREVGIDPAKVLMSITSFGEFLPVGRDRNDPEYSQNRLVADNGEIAIMDKNRRIEIVLIYRR